MLGIRILYVLLYSLISHLDDEMRNLFTFVGHSWPVWVLVLALAKVEKGFSISLFEYFWDSESAMISNCDFGQETVKIGFSGCIQLGPLICSIESGDCLAR